MPSFKHDFLKSVLNTLSLPMYWKLPPINHLRSILEGSTMMATLPWGVTFTVLEFENYTAEWLTPKNAIESRVILYLHGGGYVIGSAHTHRSLAGKIAKGTSMHCLLINYRKAPENPYPAAVQDAYNAYTYLLKTGYLSENIVIAGDSAGGGLAMAVQYMLREKKLKLPRAVVLLSPYVDLTASSKSIEKNAKNDRFLDVFEMRKWADLYANNHDLKNPLISPLYGEMSGLSPMLVQSSKSEVLFDDSRKLVRKAREAGVEVTFQTWRGLIHWWHMFGGMPEAKEAIGKIIAYIIEQFEVDRLHKKEMMKD